MASATTEKPAGLAIVTKVSLEKHANQVGFLRPIDCVDIFFKSCWQILAYSSRQMASGSFDSIWVRCNFDEQTF